MNEESFKEAIREMDATEHDVKIAGIAGEAVYKMILRAVESYRFKKANRLGGHIRDDVGLFEKYVTSHFVAKAEKIEPKIIKEMIGDYKNGYLTLHGLDKMTKSEFGNFKIKIHQLSDILKNSPQLKKDVFKQLEDPFNALKKMLDKERQLINAMWAEINGNKGMAGSLFAAMHKEGWFMQRKQRSLLKEIMRDTDKIISQFDSLKSHPDIKKIQGAVDTICKEMKEIADDYEKLWLYLTESWNGVTDNLQKLDLIITTNADPKVQNLPPRDAEQMKILMAKFREMDEKILHGLRTEINQLEGADQDMMKEAA
jgi:hypothetical protein